jgi:cytochrome c peroxidase
MLSKLGVIGSIVALLSTGCAVVGDGSGAELDELALLTEQQERGKLLFDSGDFGGNGRTCRTCHPSAVGESGQLSAADVQARFAADPDEPLFQHDGADQGSPDTFDRLLSNATIQVTIPLPDNVSIVGSDARTVTVLRSVPTTMNVGALDPVLMWDGRAPSLQAQALGAIVGHAQGDEVAEGDLDAIADFETTLFNRAALRSYASGGPAPQLPPGRTLLEIYGRTFFAPDGINAKCGWCHSGPMLNETSPFFKTLVLLLEGVPGPEPGTRFEQLALGDFNDTGNPVYTFRFAHPDGTHTDVTSPDPGRALVTGNVADVDFFKIPTVWGAKHTAPYFHDNSARTLEELVDVYDRVFRRNSMVVDGVSINFLTPLDKQAIVAYLKLL